MRTTLRVIALAAVAVMALAGTAQAQQYPPSGPSLRIASTLLQPCDTVELVALGFEPGEEIEFWLFSDPIFTGAVVANAEGSAEHSYTLPADFPHGPHSFEAVGRTSGLRASSATFNVSGSSCPGPHRGTLPFTGGSDTIPLVWLAVAALAMGTAFVVGIRRRAHTRASITS